MALSPGLVFPWECRRIKLICSLACCAMRRMILVSILLSILVPLEGSNESCSNTHILYPRTYGPMEHAKYTSNGSKLDIHETGQDIFHLDNTPHFLRNPLLPAALWVPMCYGSSSGFGWARIVNTEKPGEENLREKPS